jgi:hypothetical protein
MMASSSKKTMRQWLDKAVLQKLPSLQPDTRIREIDTDNDSNKYRYLYNVYYLKDITKEPIGVVFHKDKFYQFFHSSTTGNPYLGVLLKEANQLNSKMTSRQKMKKTKELRSSSLYRSVTHWSQLIRDN